MTYRDTYLSFGLILSIVTGCGGGGESAKDGTISDQSVANSDAEAPSDVSFGVCDESALGKHCTEQGNECGAQAACLLTSEQGGVCVCDCQFTATAVGQPVTDTCPNGFHCTNVPVSDAQSGRTFAVPVCLQGCEPTIGSNSCSGPISCLPATASLTGRVPAQAVCFEPGCQSGADCPVLTSTACDIEDTAQACPAGQECIRIDGSSTDGFCAVPGNCDTVSGLCAPRTEATTFTAGVTVGSTCADDTACDKNMRCEREIDYRTRGRKQGGEACTLNSDCCSDICENNGICAAGTCTLSARGGYCVISGCNFANSLGADFTCPSGTTCNRAFASGRCMLTCDPTAANAATCRGDAGDQYGDYACLSWNNIDFPGTNQKVTDAPICDFADDVACNSFDNGCARFNDSNLACRLISDGSDAGGLNPLGFCLPPKP